MKRCGPPQRRKPHGCSAWRKKTPDPEKVKAAHRRASKRRSKKSREDFGPHAEWVRERGCEVPGCSLPALFHHEPPRKMGGSKKPTAHRGVGLCAGHHQDSPKARHKIGLARFDAEHGTDLLAAARRNWMASPFRTYEPEEP